MRTFAYTAYTPQGREKRGMIVAQNTDDASQRIRAMGLLPGDIDLQTQNASGIGAKAGGWQRGRINHDMLSVFTRQLAVLLSAGLAADDALAAVQSSAPDKQIQTLAAQSRAGLLEGAPLSRAMADASRDIPVWYLAALHAAEQSGEMATVVTTLADYLESLLSDRSQIATALLYPAFVTVMAIAVCAVLMVTVAPEIVAMFDASGQPLPELTLMVLGIVDLVQSHWPMLVIALTGVVAALIAAARIPSWRQRRDSILLRTPLIGRFMRMGAAAQYLRTLALVINSRLPLPEALKHASAVLAIKSHQDQAQAALEAVNRGDSLSRALAGVDFLHPVARQLLEAGEASVKLGAMSARAATLAETWLKTERKRLSTLLEPLSMVMVGAMVLVIVLAILLPIFDMQAMVTN